MGLIDLDVQADVDDPDAMEVWVDGLVGAETVRFRLDTGARRCRVCSSAGTEQIPAIGIDRGVGASGVGLGEDEHEIELPTLQIGDVTLTNVAATRTPQDATVQPLLGMSALGRFRCEFRFSTRQLHLTTTDASSTEGWAELGLLTTGQPAVPVDFGDVEVMACWDTGASLTAVDAEFALTHPHLFSHVGFSVGSDASGFEMPTQLARMASCRVGDVAFEPSMCAIVDLAPLNAFLSQQAIDERRTIDPFVFILGTPAMLQADWAFDFPARRWTLNRPGRR